MTKYKVAVVGATGNVGRELLKILAERNFPASEVVALASKSSKGKEVSYGDEETLIVQSLDEYECCKLYPRSGFRPLAQSPKR